MSPVILEMIMTVCISIIYICRKFSFTFKYNIGIFKKFEICNLISFFISCKLFDTSNLRVKVYFSIRSQNHQISIILAIEKNRWFLSITCIFVEGSNKMSIIEILFRFLCRVLEFSILRSI